jgi:hypothetical protein
MQLPASDRAVLFWAGCLPARHLFASLVGARWLLNENFAAHGFFGGRAWWSSLRPFHGALAHLRRDGRARAALRRRALRPTAH